MDNVRIAPRNRRSGKGFLAAVVAAGLLAVLGFAAYKYLFNRAGEAATAFIPADASVVVTIDFTPSDRQLETFNTITQAIEDQGIAEKLDEFLKGAFDKDPMGAEIRQHLKRNFAFAVWEMPGGKSNMTALMAVDDAGAVTHALESKAKPNGDGIYTLSAPGPTQAMVMDNYLVVGDSAESLQRIKAVRAGKEKSVATLPAFGEARSSLPKDANLMVFIGPSMLKQMSDMPGMGNMNPFKGSEWMAYSATVEPEGLAFDYHCPFDANAVPGIKNLANIQPFSLEALKGLPEGAYGVMGLSQVGVYWNWTKDMVGSQESAKEGFDKGIAEFEKESGLSISGDILPALQGQQILACYPGPTGDAEDLDFLAAVTNDNGATPAALAEKVRAIIERESTKHNQPVKFTESKIGDVTVWEIDEKGRSEMLNGIYGSMEAPARNEPMMSQVPEGMPPMDMPVDPNMMAVPSQPAPSHSTPYVSKPKTDMAKKYKDKSMLLAVFPDKVVVTSSHALLNKMIDSKQGGRSLADAPAFQGMKQYVLDGSQSVMMVDLKRIMETLRPTIEKNMKDAPIKVDDILNLFGDGTIGLVGSGVYDGKVTRGRMFLPLDWQRLIHMAGSGIRSMEGGMGGPAMGGPDMSAPMETDAPPTMFAK